MFSFNTVLKKFRSTFIRKLHIGTDVSKYNLCAFLNSCTKIRNCQLGLQIHAKIVQYGHTNNLILSTALVDFYGKCSAVEDARRIFDMLKQHDEVSWTSIIYGYSQYGCGVEANKLFKKMLESDIKPNCFTYVSIIAACSRGEEPLEQGKLVHAHVIKLGFVNHSFVVSSLIDYYSKCRNVDGASMIFYEAKTRDNVVYSSMIASYCQNFYVENAIRLYLQMRNWGINVTDTTMSSILHAATMVSNVQFGRQVHGLITKLGFLTSLFVLSSLIELYSKNGFINEAQYVFDQTIERNNVLWTSMVSGYARSGKAMEALELFDQMMAAGFLPDHVCFTAVLSACNLAGFLDRGLEHFNKMIKYYDLSPTLDEYACLIDLYARQGHLSKAVQVMDDMPFEPNCVILTAVLNSCKTYGAVELGREAFNRLFAVQPHNSAACLTMARLYAEAGLWDEAANIRNMMKPKGVEKGAAWSWVDADEQLNVS